MKSVVLISVLLWSLICLSSAGKNHRKFDIDGRHPKFSSRKVAVPPEEQDNSYWNQKAQATLLQHVRQSLNTETAKNVIMFLGDGMSIPTLVAARMYQREVTGQKMGEGNHLSFEDFPYSGLSMTYCIDKHVADSACTATAYLGGVKGNYATIGVNGHVMRGDCESMRNTSNHVNSIAAWAQKAGKWTGIVSNARITHASPAGAYAHVGDRDWESDKEVVGDGLDSNRCDDIARQLINNDPGKNFNVILGGGRTNFIPQTENDPQSGTGKRLDGVNLIESWKLDKWANNNDFSYAWNREQLLQTPDNTTHLLGLFNKDHLNYRLENNTNEPSVTEMTEAAIKVLQQSKTGYFLFVEGARIDMAHHENWAHVSLDETLEFSNAIRRAAELTSERDTLIVVTADHAHTVSVSGYADRDKSVLGVADKGSDNIPYTVLSYANGPGYRTPINNQRPTVTDEDLAKYNFRYPSTVPLGSETHGGDDVAVFSRGPWAHLLQGSFEQNLIPHVMAFASCVGDGLTACSVNEQ